MTGRATASGGRARVAIGVLGPLTAAVDGSPVDLGGPAPRRLVAALAAARGSTVSVDRLVDAVWEGRAVPSAVGSLHAYVSTLRRVLEPARGPREPAQVLVRSGAGYVLRIEPQELDAERFTAAATAAATALASGDAAGAAGLLDEALALWRGDAYVDCTDAAFARPEIVRLEGLRVAAQEDRWAAALALGQASRAVPELEALVEAHPLRERAAELLATALYRAGRQADALDVLRAVRHRLVDELGIDPGPALMRLEAQVLAQDPALTPAVAPAPAGPPAHAGAPSRRIPRQRTSFIGRRSELDRLAGLLDEAPLVTLTGPAGIGKTRLAVEAAAQRADPDGPWFVELAGVQRAEDLPGTVAATLELTDVSTARGLTDALARRRSLLVLDNCEHLVGPVAELTELLLDRCPDLRLLTTSRESLDLPGEVLVEVEPLPAAGDGVELLRQRLAAVGATDDDGPEVLLRLCRELDGLPLALELAAAQCRALSPAQVADLLQDRFGLLRSSARSSSARHSTLEAAVSWSFDLLEPEQQRVFTRLSVFRAPFDLSLAEAVTGPDALVPLRQLVAKSLVALVPGSSPRRLRLLESLRQFGAARIAEADRAELARAHLVAMTDAAEAADRRLRTPDGPTWLARLEESLPDVRAALQPAADGADDGGGELRLRLATAVSWFCYRRGHVADGVRWLRETLAAAPDAGAAVRSRALIALAVTCYLTGDYTAGGELLGPARVAALAGDDPVAASSALSFSAYLRIFDGDLGAAEQTARDALVEIERLAEPAVLAEQTMLLGQVLRFAGRTDEALATLDRASELAATCGHTWVAASSRWIACKVLTESGADAAAAERLPGLLSTWVAEGDVTSWLVAGMTYAGCLARLGEPEAGAVLLGAVAASGELVGFDPVALVQFGGPDDAESVRTRLAPERCTAALAYGREHAQLALDTAALGPPLQAPAATPGAPLPARTQPVRTGPRPA